MSERNPDVVRLVERALRRNPSLKSSELREKASAIDESVLELTGRQFHAQYALQARRRLATKPASSARKARRPRARTRTAAVDPLHQVLQSKKKELGEAIDRAFQQQVEADSVSGVSELFATIDRQIKNFEKE